MKISDLMNNSMRKKRNAFILLIGVSVVAILLVKALLVPTSVWRGSLVMRNDSLGAQERELLNTNLLWMNNKHLPLDAIPRQLERLTSMQKVCKKKSPITKQFQGIYPSAFMSFRNVSFALLPKTGSTNILRMICITVGPECTNITGYPDEYHYVPRFLQGAGNLTKYTKQGRNSKFIFTFVRNPWRRLVSTYIEKVLFTDSYIAICSWNKNEKFNSLYKEMKANNLTLTFKEFLRYCVIEQYFNGGAMKMEPHYRPQILSGALCEINYNFIGQTETYGEDIKVVLEQFQISNIMWLLNEAKKYRKPNEKAHLTSSTYLQHWKTVDIWMIDLLKEIYADDFEMLNYPLSPF